MGSKKQTAIDWLQSEFNRILVRRALEKLTPQEVDKLQTEAFNRAKQIEAYNSKMQAKRYYLKGFEDAELTETQQCSHEQTMRDAETHFELVYPFK